mmetsp:Transcript_19451/g.41898  ORF Transcript_19451/g.41898 Transcript_19451/m.41898 type:complete len:267 (+) Transcript_19451:111-911(+)
MSDSGNDGDGPDFPIYSAVVLGLAFGWICCCCYTTKGCTDCSYHRDNEDDLRDDPVWGVAARVRAGEVSDRRLALELQARELAEAQQPPTAQSPEEVEAERRRRQERVQSRTDFLHRNLVNFSYREGNDDEDDDKTATGVPKDIEAPITDQEDQGATATCTICMEPFQTGDRMAKSDMKKCQHTFHYDCMVDWLVRKQECPICRTIFLRADQEREEKKKRQQQLQEQQRAEHQQEEQQGEQQGQDPEEATQAHTPNHGEDLEEVPV